MRWPKIVLLRLRSLFRRDRVECELEDEFRFHLEHQIAANIAQGMPPQEARLAALRSFGGVAQIEEECRDARRLGWLEDLLRDLRFAARNLRHAPAFALIAVLTLAIGIAANTAVLAVMNAVLLPRLPYPSADELVDVYNRNQKVAWDYAEFVSLPMWNDWRAQSHSFTDLAAHTWIERLNLSGAGEATRVRAVRVSANLFDVLGIAPAVGRGFTTGESDSVAIITDRLWKQNLSGRADALGRTIRLNRQSYTVVGVLPAGFQLGSVRDRLDVLLPLDTFGAGAAQRDVRSVIGIGRLRPGVSAAAALADLSAISSRAAKLYPATDGVWDANVIALSADLMPFGRSRLYVFLGLAALVLIIACINVALLLLARGEARRQQVLVRMALGATRRQLVGVVVCESMLVAAVGGALAILLGVWATRALLAYVSLGVNSAPLDLRVLSAVVAMCVAAAAMVAAVPALLLGRGNIHELLNRAGARLSPAGRWRLPLVAGEIAVGLALTVCAGLLVRSLREITRVDLGFDPRSVISAQLSLDPAAYPSPVSRIAFFDRLQQMLRAHPGIEVSAGSSLPIGGSWVGNMVEVPGQPAPQGDLPYCLSAFVYPDYFRVLRTPLVEGRTFAASEAEPAVIINQTMARRFFPGHSAVGKLLNFHANENAAYNGAAPGPRRVIGVSRDVESNTVEYNTRGGCVAFFPYAQNAPPAIAIIVRASDPAAAVAELRRAVAQLDPAEPLYNVQAMQELVTGAFGTWQFQSWFAALAAAIALLLAAMGVWGIVSHSVHQHTHEIAIRMALGGRPGAVVRGEAVQSAAAVAAGIVGGVLLTLWVSRCLTSLLFRVSAFDLPVFLGGTLVLAATAVAASYIPARRAARVDPMIALRYE